MSLIPYAFGAELCCLLLPLFLPDGSAALDILHLRAEMNMRGRQADLKLLERSVHRHNLLVGLEER